MYTHPRRKRKHVDARYSIEKHIVSWKHSDRTSGHSSRCANRLSLFSLVPDWTVRVRSRLSTMFPGFMQAAILTVIVILAQTTKRVRGDDDSHVLALTKDTFDEVLKNNKYLLVKFVAPWCGHCKSLVPAYAAAAKILAESGSEIKLASVDATIEQDLAQKFEVKGYPTIKFFSDGTTFEYSGGRTQDEIVSWLKKKTGPAADELKTVDDLNKLKKAGDVVVIGAFRVSSIFPSRLNRILLCRIWAAMLLLLTFKSPKPSMVFHSVSPRTAISSKNSQWPRIPSFSWKRYSSRSLLSICDQCHSSLTKAVTSWHQRSMKVRFENSFNPINFP